MYNTGENNGLNNDGGVNGNWNGGDNNGNGNKGGSNGNGNGQGNIDFDHTKLFNENGGFDAESFDPSVFQAAGETEVKQLLQNVSSGYITSSMWMITAAILLVMVTM